MEHDEVRRSDRGAKDVRIPSLACLAMLPFLLLFFPLVLMFGPGYALGFFLLLLDGVLAAIVAVVLGVHALRAAPRERSDLLLVLIFPGFVMFYMFFYGVSVVRFGMGVLRP